MTKEFKYEVIITISLDDEHTEGYSESSTEESFKIAFEDVVSSIENTNLDIGNFVLEGVDINLKT